MRRVVLSVVLAVVAALAGPAAAVDVQYVYDALGRLVQVIYPSGKVVTYTYDAAGNITSIVTTP